MADYLKSPVFSSPSYWIALGVGVVGIGAAAMQERKGSAAKKYDTPFDPSLMSDKPGSATPRQIAILMRMGALMPHGKDVHGKTMRLSMRQASGLIRSMGEMQRADKASMRGAGSMARSSKVTQKRLDKDEALFDRRFGGLATDAHGDNIQIDFSDHDALQRALDNHTLWTHVEGDWGTYLLPGMHRVNRIDYYISNRPWTDADLDTLEIAWTK
jgi:hypothetical protein